MVGDELQGKPAARFCDHRDPICLNKDLIQNVPEETTKCYLTLGFSWIARIFSMFKAWKADSTITLRR